MTGVLTLESIPLGTLSLLLDQVGEALIVTRPDGRILAANARSEEVFGWQRDLLQGLTVAEAEAAGYFLPAALRRCLADSRRHTLIQEVRGRRLAMVAARVADVCTVTARDITEVDRLQRQVERMEQEREQYRAAEALRPQVAREQIITSSKAMQKVLDLAGRIAQVDSTVLILGESGAGKGLLAKAIHQLSPRAAATFVRVDCGALPETLLESELFGYVSGAFTGARREGKVGLIEHARGGTIFLDEMAELSPAMQVKLLHVIQEKSFTRVGSVQPITVDVRIMAATHRDLREMVQEKRFREDLFYRLNVVPITIPPLRERREDIPALVRHFLDKCRLKYRVEKHFSTDVVQRLVEYDWPGNVRELENMVERLVVTTEGNEVHADDLPAPLAGHTRPITVTQIVPLQQALEALEMELIAAAYREYGSSVKVGKVLGIHQTTAARKIREWQEREKA